MWKILLIFTTLVIKVNLISQKCSTQYEYFKENLKNDVEWARKLRDSWGNVPSGTFSGNRFDFGSFDQCLKIHHKTSSAVDTINGQYCVIFIEPFKKRITERIFVWKKDPEATLGIGFCLPDSCSTEDVKIIGENEMKNLFNATLAKDYEQSMFCTSGHQPIEWNYLQIIATIIFTVILLTIVISTVLDILARLKKTTKTSISKSFSALSNSELILSLKHGSNDIKCIHGLRAASAFWIIFGHVLAVAYKDVPAINSYVLVEWVKNLPSMFIVSAIFGVDTFFVLTSLLLTLSFFRQLENNKLNITVMLVKRYFRITTPFAAGILLALTFYEYFGDGPLWNITTRFTVTEFCRAHWWSAFTYTGNYLTVPGLCFGHSWYLMVDMQLYFLSPLVLYPIWKLRKHPKIVVAIVYGFSSFSILYVFFKMMNNNGIGLSFNITSDRMGFNKYIYLVTHTRLDAWMMGIFGGYLLSIMNGKLINLSRSTIYLGWILSITTIFTLLFIQYPFHQEDIDESILMYVSIYEAIRRILWSMSIVWIIIACQLSHGGIIGRILSSSIWLPISKLAFCIYLMHAPVQLYYLSTIRVPQVFSTSEIVHKYLGDVGLSVIIAFVWSLLFEYPTLNFIAYLTGKNR